MEALLITRDDTDTLASLEISGHQLLHCHGINTGAQERAKTVSEKSFSKRFQPRPGLHTLQSSPETVRRRVDSLQTIVTASPPAEEPIRRKKKSTLVALRSGTPEAPRKTFSAPLTQRLSPRFGEEVGEGGSSSGSGGEDPAPRRGSGDELYQLQQMVAEGDLSFEEYQPYEIVPTSVSPSTTRSQSRLSSSQNEPAS